jgi:hypothetical protein
MAAVSAPLALHGAGVYAGISPGERSGLKYTWLIVERPGAGIAYATK